MDKRKLKGRASTRLGHPFPWRWRISDGFPAKGLRYHGSKVFSTFACGGGSSMGYKLAGYDVVGALDIDLKMCSLYERNLKPGLLFNEDIRRFRKRRNLPPELFELDVLDGSPPCTSFSMAGDREKVWGKKRRYAEGAAEQTLDDLFIEYVALVARLRPRFVIAENVPGIKRGNARAYLTAVGRAFNKAGYDFMFKTLNASRMGVPQVRERMFFFCMRKDVRLGLHIEEEGFMGGPRLDMRFNWPEIPFSEVSDNGDDEPYDSPGSLMLEYWDKVKQGENFAKGNNKNSGWQRYRYSMGKPGNTLTSSNHFHPVVRRPLNKHEVLSVGTFPEDYDFMDGFDLRHKYFSSSTGYLYVVGESVPPVMMAQVALEVWRQWISARMKGRRVLL